MSRAVPGRVRDAGLAALVLLLLGTGPVVLLAYPVVVVHCHRTGDGRVWCRAELRVAGLFPVWSDRLVDVRRAEAQAAGDGGSCVRLTAGDGRTLDAPAVGPVVKPDSPEAARRVNEFLADSATRDRRVWQVECVPLTVGGGLTLIPLLLAGRLLWMAVRRRPL